MAEAIAQDRKSCQFPFVLDEKPTVVIAMQIADAGKKATLL